MSWLALRFQCLLFSQLQMRFGGKEIYFILFRVKSEYWIEPHLEYIVISFSSCLFFILTSNLTI
jgi:hypothetical protein